jgi:hypothetical protein
VSRRDPRTHASPETQTPDQIAKKAQPDQDVTQQLVGNQAAQLLNEAPAKEPAKEATQATAQSEGASLDRERAGRGRSNLKKAPGGGLDLKSEQGIKSFVATLGLPTQQSKKIAAFLSTVTQVDAKELAHMFQMLAMGELGIRRIERLILADDDVSTRQVWDEDPAVMCFCPDFGDQLQLVGSGYDTIDRLFRLFPRACQKVRYVMLGNFEGRETEMAEYELLFPNAVRIEAWQNETPGNWRNAIDIMKAWESTNADDDEDEDKEAS